MQETRIYWRSALRLSTNFFVTHHLSTSAEIAALSGKFPDDELKADRELELQSMLNFDAFELVHELPPEKNTPMTWCGLMNGEVTG